MTSGCIFGLPGNARLSVNANSVGHYHVLSETHKGLKRVTRVQCSWIFTFTIFGNLSDRYPFSTKWLPHDHHADVLRQEFCISSLKIHR